MEKRKHLGISGWLVRTGLAANQTSADLTLVVIAALLIWATMSIFQYGVGANQAIATPLALPANQPMGATMSHH